MPDMMRFGELTDITFPCEKTHLQEIIAGFDHNVQISKK